MIFKTALILLSYMLCSGAGYLPQTPEGKQPIDKLQSQFGLKADEFSIIVDISDQMLYLAKDQKIIKRYLVSTSKYGAGNRAGSHKTPLGTHRICHKIGEGAKINTIFKAGINTGKTMEIGIDSKEDLITTRIMWLKGLEAGINKGNGIDSYNRRIYIHGTPEEELIGRPASYGCIRMKNKDVIELFNLLKEGTLVEIKE